MREFWSGARLLLRGFGTWRTSPGAMAGGLVPAVIVAALFAVALVALVAALAGFTDDLTPFADDWAPVWATLVRTALAVAVFAAAVFLAVVSFTAVTLIVGEPFYDRVWRAVETADGGSVPDAGYGFWRAVGDAVGLILRGIGVALLAAALGLVPLVGTLLAAVAGTLLTGWLLADELSSRALTARGIPRSERRRLLRAHRARALGFGVATQLCFLVPLGAVAVMPAAVAGSTLLAREVLSAPRASAPAPR